MRARSEAGPLESPRDGLEARLVRPFDNAPDSRRAARPLAHRRIEPGREGFVLHPNLEDRQHRPDQVVRGLQHLDQGPGVARLPRLDQGREQIVAVLEMPVETATGHTQAGGKECDPDRLDAVVGEGLERRPDPIGTPQRDGALGFRHRVIAVTHCSRVSHSVRPYTPVWTTTKQICYLGTGRTGGA
jgi:hypothetical protein